jgi:hypothetical protein
MRDARRQRGRPRLQAGCDTSKLSVDLPAPLHDEIARLALARRVSLSTIVRRALISYSENCRAPQTVAS